MASTIAAGTTSGTALAMSGDTSGNLDLKSGTTTVLALTATGIAVTGTLSASGVTTNAAGSAALPSITTTGDTDTGVWFPAANTLAASTGGSERVRIDSSGNLLVGTTSVYGTNTLNVLSLGSGGCAFFKGSNASAYDAVSIQGTGAGTNYMMAFRTGASGTGTQVGGITSTASATSYATSSDYRLKDNVTPMTGALATIAKLKPCNYKWIADGSDGQGFIAHEIQAVVPDCVVGEKDAVDDEGKPKYQGIDTSFLVATLTAAIQEQQALIIQLQADVSALKGIK